MKKKRHVDVPGMLTALGIDFRDRSGEYWANCPSPRHNERTPSWSINYEGAHHCFGCKWQGGPLELIVRTVGLSGHMAAVGWLESKGLYNDGAVPLAVKLNIHRPTERKMDLPRDVKIYPLAKWVTPARRYAHLRGVTAAQVDRWRLGYAAGGYYANRLILPTWSRTGALLNITGRAWSATKKPKYKTSREDHGWDPGAIFGEQFWPEDCTRSAVIVVEGELNALACDRVGALYVGALGGSSLQKEQVLKLSKFQRVILAMDIDQAGSQIAEDLHATISRWRRCDVIKFTDKRDPNDLQLQDPDYLRSLLGVG